MVQNQEITERAIQFDDPKIRLSEIWSEIEERGTVFLVQTDFGTFGGEYSFVVGPVSICGRVLGLYDEEYGWPVYIDAGAIEDFRDLVPRRRRHVFILRGAQSIAAGIQFSEYREIRRRMALEADGEPSRASWKKADGETSC